MRMRRIERMLGQRQQPTAITNCSHHLRDRCTIQGAHTLNYWGRATRRSMRHTPKCTGIVSGFVSCSGSGSRRCSCIRCIRLIR